MTALPAEARTSRKSEPRKTGWLGTLERELKQRIGWTDAALTPFARKSRSRTPKLQRAA